MFRFKSSPHNNCAKESFRLKTILNINEFSSSLIYLKSKLIKPHLFSIYTLLYLIVY